MSASGKGTRMDETHTLSEEYVQALHSNASHGARYLDQFKPGWFKQIDLDRLQLHDCTRCVLGQLYVDMIDEPIPEAHGYEDTYSDGYDAGLDILCPPYGDDSQQAFAETNGFDLPGPFTLDPERDDEWDILRRAWVEQIKERLDG